MQVPYGQSFVLRRPLTDVECWNSSRDSTSSFAVGETITLCRVYDATHTTVVCAEKDGRPLTNKDGTPDLYTVGTQQYPRHGYRFIVPNQILGEAIGIEMPATTPDLVGDLIAYETGEATPEQEAALFETLRETGIGKKLQGHYSSRA